jgi:riboflavin synthase
MFTGLITALGEVREAAPIGQGQDMHLTIAAPPAFLAAHGGTEIGASIACSGCCLTAIAVGEDFFTIQASAETLACTAIGSWVKGTRLNLERSLRFGDELGGHLVSGHVDGVGRVVSIAAENASTRIAFSVPAPLHRYIAEKGSVAVDGVSLTVNAVRDRVFGVNIIPHTASHTTLGLRVAGDAVHIEIDMLARYVARLQETAPVLTPMPEAV